MNHKICLCAGHGGGDPGMIACDTKTTEHSLNVQVVEYLAPLLRGDEFDVNTITNDKLTDKIRKVNASNYDLALDIHFNAVAGEKKASGYQVLYFTGSIMGRNIADHIGGGLYETIPFRPAAGGTVPRNNLAFLKQCVCPAVIVESLFLDNPVDFSFLQTPRGVQFVARGIRAGLLSWYQQN